MSNHGDSTQKKDKSPEEEHLDATHGPSHHFVKDYDGGKCLWRGIHKYKRHSCSYRYQAVGSAKEDAGIYNWPAYEEAANTTGVTTNYKPGNDKTGQNAYPHWYRLTLDPPSKEDWDVKGKNFKTSGKPYWNQAHHLIPIASFLNSLWNAAIDLAATRLKEGKETLVSAPELALYIGESLLRTEYNINHKKNMIILPMDNSVSNFLRLPKHGGPNSNNHPDYNDFVESELDKIMSLYCSCFCDLPDREHLSEEDRQAQKRRLELLSRRIYRRITQHCRRKSALEKPYEEGKSLESEFGKPS